MPFNPKLPANPRPPYFFAYCLAAAILFWGYAWLAFAGRAPWHVFFWNEELLSSRLPGLLGTDWDSYVTGTQALQLMQGLSIFSGALLILAGFAAAGFSRFPKAGKTILVTSSIVLLTWAVLSAIDRIFFPVQFGEYALRWSFPLFLTAWWHSREHRGRSRMLFLLRLAIAVTFAAHGLYAMGVFPRPAQFVEMTMSILPISEPGAVRFLIAAGVLDWLAALCLFIPVRGIQAAGAAYMVAWGLLTTLARWAAHVHFNLPWWPESLLSWTPEVMVRIPHFAGPLLLLTFMRRNHRS